MSFDPAWAPQGVARLRELFHVGYFDGQFLYRVVPGFLVQFGVANDQAMTKKFVHSPIPDDPHLSSHKFERGTISFAGSGPDSRAADIFISYAHSTSLGKSPWEVPLGVVTSGMESAERFYSGYGEISAFNKGGPNQQKLRNQGEP
jgi:peptidyl-prolyl cis-trans isomerase A (cyclophilin A)